MAKILSVLLALVCCASPLFCDEAADRMKQRLIDELQAQIGDGEIVSYTCSVSESDELLYLTLRAECLENIAISGEI